MDNEELEEKLDIIFDKEYFNEDRLEKKYISEYFIYELPGGSKSLFGAPPLLISNPEYYELHFPSHKLLMGLFNQISNNDINLKFFIDYMLHKIESPRKPTDLILAFDTLFRLDYIEDAFNAFYTWCQDSLILLEIENSSDIKDFLESYVHLIDGFEDIIRYEYNKISDKNLDSIEQNINELLEINRSILNLLGAITEKHGVGKLLLIIKKIPGQTILKQINQIRYDKLVTELTGETNLFQITEDREKVKEKIGEFGFSPTLNKALNKVEDYYWNTSSDEFDYSSAIKLLRQFHEKLIKEICSKIKEKTNDDYPTDMKTPIANLRKYMKKHLQVERENKLINGLVDLINNKGSHALTSEKEYFRLTKNMTIEVALLLLSKLEKFLQK